MEKNDIIVRQGGAKPHHGVLRFHTHHTRCALGAAGTTAQKQEGDKKTPIGRFPVRRIWWRPDRYRLPQTHLPINIISQKSGWCDDVSAPAYNRPITLPDTARHEKLWRHDHLYDVFIELGVNDAPPQKGRGSAIFLHLEKNNYQPTLGCIAISRASMDFLLRHVRPDTHICIDQWG